VTDAAGGEVASWPSGAPLAEDECVAARCDACALAWRIHRSMAGFRIRCRCGAWVAVPVPPGVRALPGSPAALAESRATALAAPDDDEASFLAAAPRPRELAGVRGWDGRPLRPDADGSWSMRHAEVATRTKWTNRVALSLAAIMACFLGPPLVVQLTTSGAHEALWMPIVSIAGSLLVLVVAHAGREYATQGLRGAAPRYFLEAVLVSAGTLVLALGWVKLVKVAFPNAIDEMPALRREIGLPMMLFVISLCPGVFEELAFRGLLQGRLNVLMGRTQALLVVGAAFGAAHGFTLGLPFHIGIGIWLAYLRDRSGSLVPGMIAHMLYNAGIVVALSS
jgi:membrane protease YdiL (CAAX protease family)